MRDSILLDSLKKQEGREDITELFEDQLQQTHPTKLYRLLQEDWESSTISSTPAHIREEIWQRLSGKIDLPENKKEIQSQWPPLLKRALLPLLGLVFILAIFNYLSSPKQSQTFGSNQKINKGSTAQKVNLGGNLFAWISKGSRIDYDQPLVGSVKSAKLSGEGYFEMSPDSNRAFYIHAGPILIEAIGARINVEAIGNDQQLRVSILDGEAYVKPKAKLEHEPSRLHLLAGDELRYNPHDHYSTVYVAMEKGVLAWREDNIAFNNHSLEAAFAKLERYYNVEIKFDPKTIKECRTNIGPNPIIYEKGTKLESVLTSLLKRKKLQFTVDGKVINIKGKGC